MKEKKDFVEKLFGVPVPDYFLRHSYENIYLYNYVDEDADNIEEILKEIEIEHHKNLFIKEVDILMFEMDMMEKEEYDDQIVVDIFYY